MSFRLDRWLRTTVEAEICEILKTWLLDRERETIGLVEIEINHILEVGQVIGKQLYSKSKRLIINEVWLN